MTKIFLPNITPKIKDSFKERDEQIARDNERLRKEELARKQEELSKLFAPVPPFPAKLLTEEAKQSRLQKSIQNFWSWDKIYFPPEYYPDYSKPGKFHQELVSLTELHDKKAHIVIGSRIVAKTSTFKKKFIYDFLHGKRRNMGFGQETVTPAENFLLDIIHFLQTNERILFDYQIEWLEESKDKLFARSNVNPKGTYVDPLSLERSSRGRSRGIVLRYDYIFVTDWENATSSLTKEAAEERIDKLNEMRGSLSDNGTCIAEGNNFDPDCAQNILLNEYEKGILSENFEMHLYPAWDDKRPGKYKSIWYSRYPAKSESELKVMMKPKDQHDWNGNYQTRPTKKSGDHFPDSFYHEWGTASGVELPADLKAVLYVDPNISLKGKGDTTAIPCFGFSAKLQKYFITAARCRSYFDSSELLKDLLTLKKQEEDRSISVIAVGMDGNVTQESIWENNILQFTRLTGFPFPYILYKKYKVDDLVTSVEGEYKKDKFYFPPGFSQTEEGKEFLKQFFTFTTKKAKKKDDAPDSLICAYTLLLELGISFTVSSDVEWHSVSNRQIHKI